MRVFLVIAAALVIASGCLGPVHSPRDTLDTGPATACSPYSSPTFSSAPGFQGSNAFAHVLRLACDFTKTPAKPTYRIPGTPGRVVAAEYLYREMRAAGWTVSYQNFTGAEYQALPKGSVSTYTTGCRAADEKRVHDIAFSNVIGDLGAGSHEYILLAHYDSQLYASHDANETNRTLPDLGANDGLSGVGVMLEAARVLVANAPDLHLRWLFDDGEDGFDECHPLAGTIYYARNMPQAERDAFRGAVLLDMVGDQEPHFCVAGNAPELREEMRQAAVRQVAPTLASIRGCGNGLLDDHTAFIDVGLKAIDLIDYGQSFPPEWDTRSDVPASLSNETLGDVGRTLVDLFGTLT